MFGVVVKFSRCVDGCTRVSAREKFFMVIVRFLSLFLVSGCGFVK